MADALSRLQTSRPSRLNNLLASTLLAPANLGLHLCPIRTVVIKAFVVVHLVIFPTHSITKSRFAADLAVTRKQSFPAQVALNGAIRRLSENVFSATPRARGRQNSLTGLAGSVSGFGYHVLPFVKQCSSRLIEVR
jgi:hypothetical protein